MSIKIAEIQEGKTIKQKVEDMMQPPNLKIEYQNEQGQWA